MKIEKVNEHQIRCTLTREDLLNRELKISELAYGTEKAKSLFRDMMQQAAYPPDDRSNPFKCRMYCINRHQSGGSGRAGYPLFQICTLCS